MPEQRPRLLGRVAAAADGRRSAARATTRAAALHGGLVDRVAREAVELVREEIRRRRRLARRRVDRLAVDVDGREDVRRLVLERRRRVRAASAASRRAAAPARASPSREISRASNGHAPASSRRQRSVRSQAMSEIDGAVEALRELARSRAPACSSGHSVESTISRSTTSTSSSNTSSNSGMPRQRQKTGRSATSSGTTTLAGCRDALAAEAHADHLGAHGTVAEGEALHRRVHVEPVVVVRPREEEDRRARDAARRGRRACAPPLPPSPRGTHARCVITLVRWFGACPGADDASRSCGELALDLDDAGGRHQCLRQARPSRWISSSALAGPHVPAA